MVDPSMPWSLKGISDEAREFAKQSADDSQLPVGAWLSAVIRSVASQEAGDGDAAGNYAPAEQEFSRPEPELPQTPVQPPAPSEAPAPGTRSAGSTIERAAQIVDDFGFEPEGPARDADLIDDPAQLQAELLALERRLADSEMNTRDNLTPLIDEIERIKTRLDILNKH